MIALVAAMDQNGIIGKDGKMPWHLSADLIHFRRLTKGHKVVMGRKTFESIGTALRGRTNVVLTRDPQFTAPGCEVIHSIDEVLDDTGRLFVIGGGDVYRQFLPHASELHLTRIHASFDGDTSFPSFEPSEWTLASATFRPKDEKNPYDCTFEVYHRTSGAVLEA